MQLTVREMQEMIANRFNGDFIYMPIHVTRRTERRRPVAQLARHPRIPDTIETVEPRSVRQDNSSLHLRGILHFDATYQKARSI